MHGMTGTIGRLLFRNVQGRTVVSTRPPKLTRSQKQQQSALQRENRTRFRKASAYAKAMMLDPAMKAYYWQKARKLRLPNGYTAAIADFMRKTSVQSVNTKRYTGRAGGHISIKAGKKDFAIAGVTVTLATKEGQEIEKGTATRCSSSGEWIYRNTAYTASPENARVTVETRDRMGNITTLTVDPDLPRHCTHR